MGRRTNDRSTTKQQSKKKDHNNYTEEKPITKKNFTLHDLRRVEPITETQNKVFEYWEGDNERSLLLYGCAGSGKTFLGMYMGLCDILSKETPFQKIKIIRSAAPVRAIGFLPGSEEEKLAVYEAPYVSICDDLFPWKKSYENLKNCGLIEFVPTSFLRGVTFDDTVVIVDECQSMTWHELSSIITRVGRNSKIIFCGDFKQNDLVTSKYDVSGLKQFMTVLQRMPEFDIVEFTQDDIVRSGLVKSFIIACDDLNF